MAELLRLPFYFLRAPPLKLKLPRLPELTAMTVFGLVFLSYFLVTSGVIYDMIIEPPAIGQVRDERTGAWKPEPIMRGRLNGQYIIEGLSAGVLFSMGSFGVILLQRANAKLISDLSRYLLTLGGVLCFGSAILVSNLFLKIKFPDYME